MTEVQPQTEETFHQDHRGRPGKDTRYVKKVATRFDLSLSHRRRPGGRRCWRRRLPLVTNVTDLSELELLQAYKRQPTIEKRFSQLKTDFEVAPVYLKAASHPGLAVRVLLRVVGRGALGASAGQAMQRTKIEALPTEGRACRWPTAR